MVSLENLPWNLVNKACVCLLFFSTVTGLSFRTCPPTETAIVPANSNRASVIWVPPVIDGDGTNVAISKDHTPGEWFPIGNTTVHYTALNFTTTSVLDRTVCAFQVVVLDKTPPLMICPDPISMGIPKDKPTSNISVVWPYPISFDNSQTNVNITSTHTPGDAFHLGTTLISYTGRDSSGNEATCSFNVTLYQTNMTAKETEELEAAELIEEIIEDVEEDTNGTGFHELEEDINATNHNDFSVFHNLTPLWKGMIGSLPKTPVGEFIDKEGSGDENEMDKHDHDDHTSTIFDSPRMKNMEQFVDRNERAIEIACVTFISFVLVALIILGAVYNKTLIQALRLRHERRRTPFPSMSWEQCPQMDGLNDPLLQGEYTDYPNSKKGHQEHTLLQPGEVLPLLVNDNKKGKQK